MPIWARKFYIGKISEWQEKQRKKSEEENKRLNSKIKRR